MLWSRRNGPRPFLKDSFVEFMTPFVIPFPQIDPVLIEIGPLAIRWYSLAYIAGLVLGWRYIVMLVRNKPLWGGKSPATVEDIDDLLVWTTLGVIIGGRLGYVLFYGIIYYPEIYLGNPLNAFKVWEGGMSFHGGLLGVTLAIIFFCRRRGLDMFKVGDLVAAAVPIGLFFGRLANFINGELYGKVSNVPWAMVFPDPQAGPLPRHPSQLYEAFLEGIVIFVMLRYLTHNTKILERPGLVAGTFLASYGLFRAFVEIFRDSEAFIWAPNSGLTMGMFLSVPMWVAAGLFFYWAFNDRPKFTLPKRQPK